MGIYGDRYGWIAPDMEISGLEAGAEALAWADREGTPGQDGSRAARRA